MKNIKDNNNWQKFFIEQKKREKKMEAEKKRISVHLLNIREKIRNKPSFIVKKRRKITIIWNNIYNKILYILYRIGLY